VLRDRRRCFVALAAGWLVATVVAAWAIRSFEWGGRLFLPTVVLLAVLMLSLPEVGGRWRRARRLAVAAAIGAAVVVQGLGLVLFRHGALTHYEISEEIHALTGEQEPIVTDAYLVPLISGRAWESRRYLFCTTRPGLDRLLGRFTAQGVSDWTYATVDRVAGSPLAVPPDLEGPGGAAWTRTDAVERRVGSRQLRLWRYRRTGDKTETGS
jgi:hypothetical protein